MKTKFYLIALLSLLFALPTAAQQKATGLSNVKLYLDPGHALKENEGLYKYTEAEKTLRVAQAIREYLLTYTDMQPANVKLCREDDNTQVTLTQRTDAANAWGADFYYSIHSDAGGVTANSTLFMYGGWRINGVIYEKTPNGGKDYGEIITPNLTGVMRISTRGNMADRTFYDAAQTHTNHYPYLHVNRESDMASLLSEAGFHTNPTQQSRNLNAQWKRLEGYAAYQSLVKFLSTKYGAGPVDPVQIGIATGFITDIETKIPINGAIVTITDGATVKTYKTDTYESLFKNYSTDPNELHNGFYFIEGLTPGATVNVKVEAVGFQTVDKTLVIPATIGATTKDGLGILDFELLNTTAPIVSAVEPDELTAVAINKPLVLTFNQEMNRATVESAISISPSATLSYAWTSDYVLRIDISQLAFETPYTLTIDGAIAKNKKADASFLDGDFDGAPGGNYVLNFTTGEQDSTPPAIVSYDPTSGSEQEVAARPIVRIEFSEPLKESALSPNQIVVTNAKNEPVSGIQRYFSINGKSVLHYFFSEDLLPERTYTVTLAPGIEDVYGNPLAGGLVYSFTARPRETTLTTVLDNFETLSGSWWAPSGSGSTTGIDTEATKLSIEKTEVAAMGSTGSLKLDYRWLEGAASHLIRNHYNATAPKFSKDNFVQYYLFGDGSRNKFRVALRNGGAGSFYAHTAIELDWVGWKKITWDISNDPFDHWLIGGTDAIPTGNVLNLSALALEGAAAADLSFLPSAVYIDELQVVKLGNPLVNSVPDVENPAIEITSSNHQIQVTAPQPISSLGVYSLTGVTITSAHPNQTSYQISTQGWTPDIYLVKVVAGDATKVLKVLVK
jgi:N-acetylmuramoyl-L-alanine amidase